MARGARVGMGARPFLRPARDANEAAAAAAMGAKLRAKIDRTR